MGGFQADFIVIEHPEKNIQQEEKTAGIKTDKVICRDQGNADWEQPPFLLRIQHFKRQQEQYRIQAERGKNVPAAADDHESGKRVKHAAQICRISVQPLFLLEQEKQNATADDLDYFDPDDAECQAIATENIKLVIDQFIQTEREYVLPESLFKRPARDTFFPQCRCDIDKGWVKGIQCVATDILE